MEASISIRATAGWRIQPGASSVKYIAAATLNGSASSRPSNDETKVPNMNGSAPKAPLTGSQSARVRKRHPNCRSEGSEPRNSSQPTTATRTNTIMAMHQVRNLKAASPVLEGGGSNMLCGAMEFISALVLTGCRQFRPARVCSSPAAAGQNQAAAPWVRPPSRPI